jgi:hypothetical protein
LEDDDFLGVSGAAAGAGLLGEVLSGVVDLAASPVDEPFALSDATSELEAAVLAAPWPERLSFL